MMTRKIPWIILLLLIGISISSCEENEDIISMKDFVLSENTLLLGIGEIVPITVNVTPDDATDPNLNWISTDESIAIVQYSENGLVAGVKGMALGSVTLTATSDNGEKTVDVRVINKVEKVELEEVEISDPSQTSYNVIFTPADATIQDVVWSSSDESVATVNNGIIQAVAPGVAVITVTSVEGSKSASVEIAVSGNPPILGLQYCTVTGTGDYHADNVRTYGADADVNYSGSLLTGNYELHDGENIIIQPGGLFDLEVTQSNNWSMTVVWADWNGDKDFVDDGERVLVLGVAGQLNDGPLSGAISVPADAKPGITRMRVLTGDAWTTDIDAAPCGEVANCSVKDFLIEVGGVSYCSVSGTGDYSAATLLTTGGTTNIDYSGGLPAGNFEYYTDEELTVTAGSSFTVNLTQSNNWSRTLIWIDWNADGTFDEIEKVQEFGAFESLNDGPFEASITVPADAVIGKTRMRVLTGDAWTTASSIIPCGEVANSCTKDFIIVIQ
ncbi:Ig domain-containing protein [Labilibacter sediminis]|nr:Ig domain-containing protein [Labilibacter sediminis]